jgi:hypothetical protein
MTGLRVIVCGGRDYNDRISLYEALDQIVIEHGPIDVLIHGNQRGADTLADAWARSRGVTPVGVPADWQRYGKSAGPVRNRRMITEHGPDLVIAFPGGRGTANMIGLAHEAEIKVIEIEWAADSIILVLYGYNLGAMNVSANRVTVACGVKTMPGESVTTAVKRLSATLCRKRVWMMSELPLDDERVKNALENLMARLGSFIGQPLTSSTLYHIRQVINYNRTDFKKNYGHEFPAIVPLILPKSQFIAWFREDLDNEEIRIKVLNLLREFAVKRIPVSAFELAQAMRFAWPKYEPPIEEYQKAKQVKLLQ